MSTVLQLTEVGFFAVFGNLLLTGFFCGFFRAKNGFLDLRKLIFEFWEVFFEKKKILGKNMQ